MLEKTSSEKEDAMSQWISVKDDLPDVGQDVIVATKHGRVTMVSYEALRRKETTTFMWVEGDWVVQGVTHWQPLPEHPDTAGLPRENWVFVDDDEDDHGSLLDADEYYD